MKIEDLTQMDIEGLRAVFPSIIMQSAPLVQITLKKLFQIIEDAEQERIGLKTSETPTVELPLPEDVKWEAVGRGYAAELMEKQRRIDRLEQTILYIYESICKDAPSVMIVEDSDDAFVGLYGEILDRVAKLKRK